jgi:hypothetical protein
MLNRSSSLFLKFNFKVSIPSRGEPVSRHFAGGSVRGKFLEDFHWKAIDVELFPARGQDFVGTVSSCNQFCRRSTWVLLGRLSNFVPEVPAGRIVLGRASHQRVSPIPIPLGSGTGKDAAAYS